jgi:outer membrane receptor protein involved in Fe transport
MRSLMPGPYLIRAHLEGYVAARQTIVTVRPATRTVSTFTLRRTSSATDARVAAAGATDIGAAPTTVSGRDESETAWRLRRLKRSILKDSTTLEGLDGRDDWFVTDSLQFIGRAVESSARMAGALFSHSPLQGQVNLLTTGAFDRPGQLLQMERTRGVAFFSLGAPVGSHGDWTVKAALNHGDLSSWILAGNYVARVPARHRYQFGMSYGLHSYEGGNVAALAAMPETARNVGAVYGYDDWKLSERVTLGYGGHYAHYDYLFQPSHLSPRISASIAATDTLRVRAVAARRVAAPGAEEFLPPSQAQVLPPQRTFSPLTRAGFLPEDMRHFEVGVERVLDGVTLGIRAFQQNVDDQLVTVFGLRSEQSQSAELGHYFVGSADDVDVHGWGLTVTHALTAHFRGSFDYSLANAEWANHPSLDRARLSRTVASALRPASERVHDFTTTVETDVPVSATRVLVLYKINSAYTRADGSVERPGTDSRWDVQIMQALPFMNFTTAEWEMLVGVRNLFREAFTETSMYDELLVARPPKRLVGGITVKF